ncbi:GGDEF domain-containing protein [Cognaticolwellia beringensis]|uniref:diguanylate cyclase n=1 Tax=Cognaticolwellia beringensis TaxID=1967665 RepID=A0A222G8A6_9GAMM|nr:GGDEF domain-containing protein [Cognaticolwellia beringensis]ASP47843.1 GGDEF domain-containing protein [Cognaticolwellia beringensis]
MIKRSTTEKMLLILSAFAVITISPFVYLRWLDGDMVMASIDASLVIVTAAFFLFVYRTRKVDTAKAWLSSFFAVAIVTIVAIRGESHLFWLYPCMIAFYYILPARAAGIICFIAILLIAIILFPVSSVLEFLTITFTLFLTALFSYVIFNNYNKTNEKLALLASIDPLTSSGNRRALDKKLEKILADQKREASKVSLLLLDLDHFKKINDNYGHANGDIVLVELVSLIQKHTRSLDDLYRYGGEEFIILPLKVDLSEAKQIAEKLRIIIEKSTFAEDISLTVSIGVSQYHAGETAEAWISRADAALYVAKDSGRNRVVTETEVTKEAIEAKSVEENGS